MAHIIPFQKNMSSAKAIEIDRRLTQAYFALYGISGESIPSLSDIRLSDALQASQIVSELPNERRNGITIVSCHVHPSEIPRLFAQVLIAQY
jgi:hypothetical protein